MSRVAAWWARLPRDTRDSFFLLAVISAVMLPHAGHLPLWASALTGLVLLWRAQIAWRQRPLPSRWWLLGIALAYALLTWLTFRTLVGREAGITLLTVLMALKTLELRARRDAFVVFFLGFFLVLTQFLYSQSLLTALWSLLSLWGLLAAVVLAAMASETPESLPLADGCRAEVDVVGGFGDTDHHVLHRCAVAGLWQRSTPLQSDTEAVLQRLRAAAPSTDGALQIAVTRARYGQPDEQLLLRIPPR